MPLLDHFRKPTETRAPWDSLLLMWVAELCGRCNREWRQGDSIAHAQVWRAGELDANEHAVVETGSQTPSFVFDVRGIDSFSVQIKDLRDDMRLVGAIEFISPANKDRESERTQFVSKCLSYLDTGVGLVLVDVVTNRSANLHNAVMTALDAPDKAKLPDVPIYVASYRPTRPHERTRIDTWPYPCEVGKPIPGVPLALKGGPIFPLDLDATYRDALAGHNL